MRPVTLSALLICGFLHSLAPAQEIVARRGGVEVVLSADGQRLVRLAVPGAENQFASAPDRGLWRLWWYDEATRKANTYSHQYTGYYWQDPFVMGQASLSNLETQLKTWNWDEAAGRLNLEYTHPQAEVKISFELTDTAVTCRGEFKNLSAVPVYHFSLLDNWQLSSTAQNTFILPDHTAGVEYRTVRKGYYSQECTWDGLLVSGPTGCFSLYALQDPAQYLATETRLTGGGVVAAPLAIDSGTVCFRRTGESLKCVALKISAFPDLRTWADGYVQDNFPGLKPLAEKIPAPLREKVARAVLFPAGGKMVDLARTVENLPGTAIIHTPSYMTPLPGKANGWDAFPNYFPPNPEFGTLEDYPALVETVNRSGHLFMPRNSFFYWAKDSAVDREIGVEKMAMVGVDGQPRTARWAELGWLISPSSRPARAKLEEFFNTWREMGASLYFTNVIAAIGPWGNRYDFHPDTPAPDLFYHQIRQLLAWHGERLPLLSEGGGAWQMPYQAGFCGDPGWNPNAPGADYLMLPSRGDYLGFRRELNPLLYHQYVQYYPHNASVTDILDSLPKLSYALACGVNPKFGLTQNNDPEQYYRWLRTVAVMGEQVFSRLYGQRLEQFEKNGGLIRARYGRCEIIANLAEAEYALPEPAGLVLGGQGFYFHDPDSGVTAGSFAEYAGHRFPSPQLLILQEAADRAEVWLPLADTAVDLLLPLAKLGRAQLVTVQGEREVTATTTDDGLHLVWPACPGALEKIVPHLVLTPGEAPAAAGPAVGLLATWAANGERAVAYCGQLPETLTARLRLENYSAQPLRLTVTAASDFGGREASQELACELPPHARIERTLDLPISGPGTARFNLNPVSALVGEAALTIEPQTIPEMTPAEAAAQVAPLKLDWAAPSRAGNCFAPGVKSISAAGLRLANGESLQFGSEALNFTEQVYLECLLRFDRLPQFNNGFGEVNLVKALNPQGTRSIELRYNRARNMIRFLVPEARGDLRDLTLDQLPIKPGVWYHIRAWCADQRQVLEINGQTVDREFKGRLQPYRGPWLVAGEVDMSLKNLRWGGK